MNTAWNIQPCGRLNTPSIVICALNARGHSWVTDKFTHKQFGLATNKTPVAIISEVCERTFSQYINNTLCQLSSYLGFCLECPYGRYSMRVLRANPRSYLAVLPMCVSYARQLQLCNKMFADVQNLIMYISGCLHRVSV